MSKKLDILTEEKLKLNTQKLELEKQKKVLDARKLKYEQADIPISNILYKIDKLNKEIIECNDNQIVNDRNYTRQYKQEMLEQQKEKLDKSNKKSNVNLDVEKEAIQAQLKEIEDEKAQELIADGETKRVKDKTAKAKKSIDSEYKTNNSSRKGFISRNLNLTKFMPKTNAGLEKYIEYLESEKAYQESRIKAIAAEGIFGLPFKKERINYASKRISSIDKLIKKSQEKLPKRNSSVGSWLKTLGTKSEKFQDKEGNAKSVADIIHEVNGTKEKAEQKDLIKKESEKKLDIALSNVDNHDDVPEEKEEKDNVVASKANPDANLVISENVDVQEGIHKYLVDIGETKLADSLLETLTAPKKASTTTQESSVDYKKLSETNELILKELKVISENQIDEQDTSIKKTSEAPTRVVNETVVDEAPKEEKSGIFDFIKRFILSLIPKDLLDMFKGGLKPFLGTIAKVLGKSAVFAAAFTGGLWIGDQINKFFGQETLGALISKRGILGALEDAGEGLKGLIYKTIPGLEWVVDKITNASGTLAEMLGLVKEKTPEEIKAQEAKIQAQKDITSRGKGYSIREEFKGKKPEGNEQTDKFRKSLEEKNIIDFSDMWGTHDEVKDKKALELLTVDQLDFLQSDKFDFTPESITIIQGARKEAVKISERQKKSSDKNNIIVDKTPKEVSNAKLAEKMKEKKSLKGESILSGANKVEPESKVKEVKEVKEVPKKIDEPESKVKEVPKKIDESKFTKVVNPPKVTKPIKNTSQNIDDEIKKFEQQNYKPVKSQALKKLEQEYKILEKNSKKQGQKAYSEHHMKRVQAEIDELKRKESVNVQPESSKEKKEITVNNISSNLNKQTQVFQSNSKATQQSGSPNTNIIAANSNINNEDSRLLSAFSN
jgi:hypothetical protein